MFEENFDPANNGIMSSERLLELFGNPMPYRTTMPTPVSTPAAQPISAFAGSPMQGAAGVAQNVLSNAGGGVSGSGLLNPEDFNLEVKDRLSKKEGPETVKPEMGGLMSMSTLPESVRAALSMFSRNPSAPKEFQDDEHSIFRRVMGSRFGAR